MAYVIPQFADPVKTCKLFWPQYRLYDKQQEIMYSVRDNFETIVPAGNDLGKDFIAAMTVLWFFISRRPCRILTTSVDAPQLEDVLWGEIRRFIQEARVPLPIELTHLKLYQVSDKDRVPKTECVGRVTRKGEGMLGRHAEWTKNNEPTTLLLLDECSGIEDESYEKADTWAHRILGIGNCYECNNFFYRGSEEGDRASVRAGSGKEKLNRKVIQIKAVDSPNVKKGLAEEAAGKEPSFEDLIPGLLSYDEYLRRLDTWDEERICIGLNAEFYKGKGIKLFPIMWIDTSEKHYRLLGQKLQHRGRATGIGVDPAEGGDYTTFSAVDEWGLIGLESIKTPDTSVIFDETLDWMRRFKLNPRNPKDCSKVGYDRGGGGKQHADYARRKGFNFRTVPFGGAPTQDPTWGRDTMDDKLETIETRYEYFNMRAELYGRLSIRMDPGNELSCFYLPPEGTPGFDPDALRRLREQLRVIPRVFDGDGGKLKLPPKRNLTKNSKVQDLVSLIGHSPDELDSVTIANQMQEVPANLGVVSAA